MKIQENFMVNFRWITPLLLAILTAVISFQTSEIRSLRVEVSETRKFAMQYTDKMIEVLTRTFPKR